MASDKDIRSKMIIAHNTVMACAKDSQTAVDPKTLQNRDIQFYTGETSQAIEEIKKLRAPINLQSVLTSSVDIHAFTVLCVNIREVIIEHYLKKGVVPSIYDIDNHFRNKGIDWKRFKLTTKLIFHYHHMPELKKYLIIENPKLVAKRTNYLNKIRQYRSEGRYIIYVHEKRLDASEVVMNLDPSKISKFVIMASSTREGWIRPVFSYYAKSHAMEEWFRHKMLQHVSEPCVFVISCQPNLAILPPVITPHSTKEILTDWLKRRGIPHNPDSHRGELYRLFKNYRGSFDECSSCLDDLIKNNGHEVLYVPYGYPKLNYFFRLWTDVGKELDTKTVSTQYLNIVIEASKAYSLDEWKDLENDIVNEETQMLGEDMKVEGIIDNLLTMVRDKAVTTLDFPANCSTRHLEFIDDKVNNIIVDLF